MITKDKFNKLFPKAKHGTFDYLLRFKKKYEMSDKDFIFFLANCSVECAGFSIFSENLNYSATRLLQVFPKYFNSGNVTRYANKPEKIANRVYANRMGNGDETSGMGWFYRGKGGMMITGKWNYEKSAKSMGLDLVNHPELLDNLEYAIESGYDWWKRNVTGKYTTIEQTRKIVNGGYNGLEEVKSMYNKLIS